MTKASAPGKLILCGEHAVVYGQPAIALPLDTIRAQVEIRNAPPGNGLVVDAVDFGRRWVIEESQQEPLSELIRTTLCYLGTREDQLAQTFCPHTNETSGIGDLIITINSTIPIAAGMGSGAAVATALVRALAAHMGKHLQPSEVSSLVYSSEKGYHGTPSGIDNTVIAFEQPIWFMRHIESQHIDTHVQEHAHNITRLPASFPATIQTLEVNTPLTLIIGDTGIRSKTRLPVGNLRQRWQENPSYYELLFNQVGEIVTQIRTTLFSGDLETLGSLLNMNHTLLQHMGVSSPELDHLVMAARGAGALGAKMSGGGWGGIMFALSDSSTKEAIIQVLQHAGAARVLETTIGCQEKPCEVIR